LYAAFVLQGRIRMRMHTDTSFLVATTYPHKMATPFDELMTTDLE